jgi:NAD-dependent dihydropyrimidine dehydrogenase PreA subunit
VVSDLKNICHGNPDNNVTDLINLLPGKGSVNAVQNAAIDEAKFFVFRATPSAGNGPMNSQSDTCFLCGPCRKIIRDSRITEKAVHECKLEEYRRVEEVGL